MFCSLRGFLPTMLLCLLSSLVHADSGSYTYLAAGKVVDAAGLPLANKDLVVTGAGLPYPRLVRTDGDGNFKTSLSIFIPCLSGERIGSTDSLQRLVARYNDSMLYFSCEGLSAVVPSGWWNHWPAESLMRDSSVEQLTVLLADVPLPLKNGSAAWEKEFEKIRAAIQTKCADPRDSADLGWYHYPALELIEPRNRTLTEFRTFLARFGCAGFMKILATAKSHEYELYVPGQRAYAWKTFLIVNAQGRIAEVEERWLH